jgi:hypothetical protein
MLVELQRVKEHRRALATGVEARFVARAILPNYGDTVVAVKIANPTAPLAHL